MQKKVNKRRSSPIWGISKDDFEKLVKKSISFKEIFDFFGLENKGSNYKTLGKRIEEEGIDVEHIKNNTDKYNYSKEKKPIEIYLVKNSTYHRGHLKRRLLNEGLLENKCYECGAEPKWRGKELVMVLDHINGVNNDNRLENLRMLCPNCNSQTDTFAGRNLEKKARFCKKCGDEIHKGTKNNRCRRCYGETIRKVKDRPTYEVLKKEIEEMGYEGTGRKYGVSGNAVKKWLKKYESDLKK